MGRSESKQAFQQSSQNARTDQGNAQAALGQTNAAIGDYNKKVNDYLGFGRRLYGEGGDFAKVSRAVATQGAAAGSRAVEGDLALRSLRTGENTAGYAPAVAEERRQANRDLTGQMISSEQDRMNRLAALEAGGVDAAKLPVNVYQNLYGQGLNAANGQMSSATSAAQTPGFWDSFANSLVSGAATVGAAFCPCEGSQIRLAEDHEVPVEWLEPGAYLWSLSFTAPPNPLLEKPKPRKEHCFEIVTKGGLRHRGSKTHAIALACGGYDVMPNLKGQVVLCKDVTDIVVEVNDIGIQTVYPMAVGGSHCYQADGIWCFA